MVEVKSFVDKLIEYFFVDFYLFFFQLFSACKKTVKFLELEYYSRELYFFKKFWCLSINQLES